MLTSPLLFTLLSLSLVQAKVGTDFRECPAYFYKGTVPVLHPPNSVAICQSFRDSYHFATLYDTGHRIPVYSAYILKRHDQKPRPQIWHVEPQLVNENWQAAMEYESNLRKEHPGVNLGDKQALGSDFYVDCGYHRGHLNPFYHNAGDSGIATFTLTNAVPQDPKMNRGKWRWLERITAELLNRYHKIYVLVGAVPSEDDKLNGRVNIPEFLWGAFCCVDEYENPLHNAAIMVRNTNESSSFELTLELLKDELIFLGTEGTVGNFFYNNCE